MDSRLVVLFLGICLAQVLGNCFFAELKFEDELNFENPYCPGRNPQERFTYNTITVTDDCYNCTCSGRGLSCCGFGPKNTGAIFYPKGCYAKIDPDDHCKFSLECVTDAP